jgi:membrane carboxypeptidase/penicillin-binding protein PbpC
MLINTAKSGTAKKLKNLPYDVAAKTGTSGDTTGNTDAYSISYTSQNTLGIWLGSIKNEHLSISGGNSCCSIVNNVYSQLYKTNPAPLEKYKGTEKVTIDKIQYTQNNKIMLTEPICPKLNTLEFYCLNDNKPFEVCNSFTHPNIVNPTINIKNNGVSILLFQTYYYNYLIKCDNQVVYDDKWTAEFNHVPTAGVHEYSVIPYYFDGKEKHFGSTYFLGKINLKKDNTLSPPPKISDEEWYNY